MAWLLWETDATGLPGAKKSPERPLIAVECAVRGLGVALLVATATDVLQGNFFVFILMCLFFRTSVFLIELDADVNALHECLGNTIYILAGLWFVGSRESVLLTKSGEGHRFLKGMFLRNELLP